MSKVKEVLDTIAKKTLRERLTTMIKSEKKYHSEDTEYVIWMSPEVFERFREELESRMTRAGDEEPGMKLELEQNPKFMGIPIRVEEWMQGMGVRRVYANQARMENRVGCFRFADCLMEDMKEDEIAVIFSKILIIRAEHMISDRCMYYTGFSMLFDPVPCSQYPPYYQFTLKRTDDGIELVNVEQCDAPMSFRRHW